MLLAAVLAAIFAWVSDTRSDILGLAIVLAVLAVADDFFFRKEAPKQLPQGIFLLLLFGLTLIPRLAMFDFESGDYTGNWSQWFDTLKEHGFASLKNDFHQYPPSYMYLLYGMTFTGIPKLWAIKLVSVVFDYVLAYGVYRVTQVACGRRAALFAGLISLLLPTVLMNGALWSQSDSIYTAFLLLSLGSFMRAKGDHAMMWYALAFVFKVQAVFFLLVPLYFYFSKQIRLHTFLYIPLFFAISVIPNWLVGRGFADLMMVYMNQTGIHEALTLFAPNVYQWLTWAPGHIFLNVGIAFTAALIGLFCLLVYKRPVHLETPQLVRLALLSTLLIPFFLPRMHDRYFFPADVLALVYAFYFPRGWYVAVLVSGASFFAYLYFLFSTLTIFPFSVLAAMMALALLCVLKDFLTDYLTLDNGDHHTHC